MPELAHYVDDNTTRPERAALYSCPTARPDSIPPIAEIGGRAVGYGLAHVLPAGDTWLADTWATGEHVGEIESLAVVPSRRGAAWGADFSATSSTHAMAGASTTTSSAFSGNTAALRRLSAIGLQARVDLLTNRPDDSDERPRTTTCATKAL